jgi:hypothetical protein
MDWILGSETQDPLEVFCNRLPSSPAVSKTMKEDDCSRVLLRSWERSLLERGSLHPRRLALKRLGVVDANVDWHF